MVLLCLYNTHSLLGHLRGICALAGKLAADRPITVTLLVSNEPKSFAAGKAEAMRCMDVVDTPKGKLRYAPDTLPCDALIM